MNPLRTCALAALASLAVSASLSGSVAEKNASGIGPYQMALELSAASDSRQAAPLGDSPKIGFADDIRARPDMADAISAVPRRFQYAFRLGLRAVYDDNIFLSSTRGISDFYFAFEPGLTVGWGDIVGTDQNFIRLDYAPGIFLYLNHGSADSFQHIIRLDGQYHFRRLTIVLSEEIQLLDGTNYNTGTLSPNSVPSVNLDAGANRSVSTFNTRANFSYDLSGKTFLSGGLQHTSSEYDDDLIGSNTLQANLFLNYIYSPKLTVGLGGTIGYNWVESGTPDQTFQQINARFTYQATGKISIDASGGVEFRQFEGDTSDRTHISPVFEIGATYQPFDGTSFSLRGNRQTQNSAVFAGQDYASTTISFSARQRFFQRVYLGFSIGFENLRYFNAVENGGASRNDDYFYFQPAIDLTLTRFWTVGCYYLHRENDSSAGGFGFDDNQIGLRTSLTF